MSPEDREALREAAEKLADAVLTWQRGSVVESLAQEYRRLAAEGPNSNDGGEDDPRVQHIHPYVDGPSEISSYASETHDAFGYPRDTDG